MLRCVAVDREKSLVIKQFKLKALNQRGKCVLRWGVDNHLESKFELRAKLILFW